MKWLCGNRNITIVVQTITVITLLYVDYLVIFQRLVLVWQPAALMFLLIVFFFPQLQQRATFSKKKKKSCDIATVHYQLVDTVEHLAAKQTHISLRETETERVPDRDSAGGQLLTANACTICTSYGDAVIQSCSARNLNLYNHMLYNVSKLHLRHNFNISVLQLLAKPFTCHSDKSSEAS